jgi:hypothetical protein
MSHRALEPWAIGSALAAGEVLPVALARLPNNIIHPTRLMEIATCRRYSGRVMMSVSWMGR